jgi:heme A synthase
MGAAQVWSEASGTQLTAGGVAIASVLVALFAAWRERRSARRTNPDAVGLLDWRGVQMFALITLAVSLLLVAKG